MPLNLASSANFMRNLRNGCTIGIAASASKHNLLWYEGTGGAHDLNIAATAVPFLTPHSSRQGSRIGKLVSWRLRFLK